MSRSDFLSETVLHRLPVIAAGAVLAAFVCSVSVLAQSAATRPSVGKSVKVGSGIYEIAASPSTGTIYVASAGSRNQPGAAVYALNGDSLDLVKTYDVTAAPGYGIAVNDKTQTVYTTNTRTGSVSAIDVASGRITSISTEDDKSAHLREIVVDEAENVIYASSYGNEGKVWIIDGKTNRLSHLLTNVGQDTAGLAVDSAAKRLYVTNMGANEVAIVDLATKQVIQRYPAGGERPSNLAFDAKTKRLFVANQGPGTVTVLDTTNGKVLATLQSGAGTLDVELNPEKNLVYAANRSAGTVAVFNATSYEQVASLDTGGAPNTLAIDGKTGLVYVTKKARPAPRGGGRGGRAGEPGSAPAAPPAPPAEDPSADTVSIIRP